MLGSPGSKPVNIEEEGRGTEITSFNLLEGKMRWPILLVPTSYVFLYF